MTKKFITNISTAAVFCLLLTIGQTFAQSTVTGAIRGTVKDPQGAIVPNATVIITNEGTTNAQTVNATDDGTFRVTNLQPGTYTVEVNAGSFAAYRQEKVIVEVGQVTPIEANLGIEGGVATVEVSGEAPVVNTSDNSSATNINQTSINELPINGRRASNFVLLTPATVPDGNFGLISFRGISGLLNNSTVDGGDNNQAFFSEERGRTRINYVISQSAVREFQVNTSNYSSEYGRSAGGVINTVTKSGTNEFHGDLFYYNRNNRNGARNPLAFRSTLVNGGVQIVDAKPVDLREQFGGTVGGPIIKDRLFFFFSYDQQKRNFPGLSVFNNPNFLNSADTACLTTPLNTPLVRNNITCLGKGLTLAQVNSSLSFLNSLTGETPRKGDQNIFLPKIDWTINSKNNFSISYNRMRWESPNGIQTQAVNQRGRSSFGDDFVSVDSINARLQTTLSPTILNEFRFQYGRDFERQFSTPPLPGEPATSSTSLGGTRAPSVFIQNGLEFGTPSFLDRPSFPDERRQQFADTVTISRGRHTIKFGADINRITDDIQNLRFEAGAFSYTGTNGINEFIIDYTNFLTPISAQTRCFSTTSLTAPNQRFIGRCYAGNYSQGVGNPGLKLKTYDYNFFVQDDFRIMPRLTLNIGVRYEYIKLPSTVFPSSSNTIIPIDGRTLAQATSTLPDDKDNFGPRIGFAYDVFGDGKTSVRAGYGIYYGRIQNSTIYNALVNTGNPGGQAQVQITPTTTNGCFPTVPTSTTPCAPIFPNVLPSNSLAFSAGSIQFFDENFQAPMIHQYDAIVERQLTKNTVVSVSYIGSTGRNLPTFYDLNYRRTGQTTFTVNGGDLGGQSFVVPTYNRVVFFPGSTTNGPSYTQIRSTVKSQYNALVLQGNRRFTDGLQFQASYTLAKSTDTNQNSATFTQNNSPYDILDDSFNEGPSNFDIRHKFVASAVYAPNPYKGDEKSVYNYLLNGWSIAPIFTYYSGRPVTGSVSGGSLNGTNGDNLIPILGRNTFRQPSIVNIDTRLSKRFRFTERYSLELLAEAFNIVNRTHVFNTNTTLYTRSGTVLTANPDFGLVTGTDSTLYRERQIQFAARFQF